MERLKIQRVSPDAAKVLEQSGQPLVALYWPGQGYTSFVTAGRLVMEGMKTGEITPVSFTEQPLMEVEVE